jgi:hypothetical protein
LREVFVSEKKVSRKGAKEQVARFDAPAARVLNFSAGEKPALSGLRRNFRPLTSGCLFL